MPHASRTETDPRFPSGRWVGFFLDRRLPGKHQMEIDLTFAGGRLTGTGRDRVGKFTFTGSYDLADGKCDWVKQYTGAHAIAYRGFNEGKGIWGTWDYVSMVTGGFHIWPKGMADPTQPTLSEEADVPIEAPPVVEPELVPLGA
ncbi:MAG TPA: hypothetical protein VM597_08600 [Gemmataceae bacterium]|jgi:hypothetical protein|nr:hypothetical protein [Gemmataceae bacterium]